MAMIGTRGVILGGGEGTRLAPLTVRTKPAVPFGGLFRIIDFVLSNTYNSNIPVDIVTQRKATSLHRHLNEGWVAWYGAARIRVHGVQDEQSKGTAHAVHQILDNIIDTNPTLVDIFAGDHVYIMDISQMNDFHLEKNADLVISAIPLPREVAAGRYGVLSVDSTGRVIGFNEKPEDPEPIPGNDKFCLVSMGNYAFNAIELKRELEIDADKTFTRNPRFLLAKPDKYTTMDFGKDIIPAMVRHGRKVFAYDFAQNRVNGLPESFRGYWRDIGERQPFIDAHFEMLDGVSPVGFNNPSWRIYTNIEQTTPYSVKDTERKDEFIAPGCVIRGAKINHSVISYNQKICEGTTIEDSVLLGYGSIGKNCKIKGIVDRENNIPDGTVIGYDPKQDVARGFRRTLDDIAIVPKDYYHS